MIYLLRMSGAQGVATHWSYTIPQEGFEAIACAELVQTAKALLVIDESGFPVVPLENFVG